MTLSTNKKLEQLFDLPPSSQSPLLNDPRPEPDPSIITHIDTAIDKIDAALPGVRGLEATDSEMDDLANMAKTSYEELMTLGMQVDSRFASEIFSVASNMLGHAITAKTAKLDKKLKMIDLQLKKARLDQTQDDAPPPQTGHGVVLSRNELLDRILGGAAQKGDKS
jgi:hypothetical protein